MNRSEEESVKEVVRGFMELVETTKSNADDAAIGNYPNDLIRRSALMEYCLNQKSKSIDNNDIARFPSAEAVQGEWMNAGVLTVRCSNCKSEFHELEAMNFCPNCGARMLGEDGE